MHFTYHDSDLPGDLQQGDILQRTEEVTGLLRAIHSYFLKEDYTHYLVLTQTCDLVRRGSSCAAQYINIAAVRPLRQLIELETKKLQTSAILRLSGGVASDLRSRAKNRLESILNNNVHEYFYLHSDVFTGRNSESFFFSPPLHSFDFRCLSGLPSTIIYVLMRVWDRLRLHFKRSLAG